MTKVSPRVALAVVLAVVVATVVAVATVSRSAAMDAAFDAFWAAPDPPEAVVAVFYVVASADRAMKLTRQTAFLHGDPVWLR